jgi:hypothetical protein
MAGYDQAGPSSTPGLYLEQSYNQMAQGFRDREAQLADQQLDPDSYDDAVRSLQSEFNIQDAYMRKKQATLQSTQDMVDARLISEAEGMEANWATVLPREVMAARAATMAPPEQDKMSAPFSPSQLDKYEESAGEYAEATEKTTLRVRKFAGVDILAPDVKGYSQASIMRQYKAWRTNIGYDSMDANKQRQVDSEWDSWVGTQGKKWKWDRDSNEVKSLRAKGKLSRGYGSQFRGTPTAPTEARNPIHDSIAKQLPTKRYDEQATPLPGEEAEVAEPKVLTKDIIRAIRQEAGGDIKLARQMAAERGYKL